MTDIIRRNRKAVGVSKEVLAARKASFPKLSVKSFKQLKSASRPIVRVPKAAQWGWLETPLVSRLLFGIVVLSLIAFATPFWASVTVAEGIFHHATFGLWHYCLVDDDCVFMHESLLPGKTIPVWHLFAQGTYAIGTLANIIAFGFVVHCSHGVAVKMSPTTQRTTICILGIAATQQLTALYTFGTYFAADEFLHHRGAAHASSHDKDLHGSFFAALIAFFLTVIAILMMAFDEGIPQTSPPRRHGYRSPRDVTDHQQAAKKTVRFANDAICYEKLQEDVTLPNTSEC